MTVYDKHLNKNLSLFNFQILQRLCDLCLSADGKRNRKHEQRLLRNMGAHNVILDLLVIPYEKVRSFW